MGTKIFIYTGEQNTFDANGVRTMLNEIPGVSNIRATSDVDNGYAILTWHYTLHENEVEVRLTNDLTCIVTDGISDADLQLALEIQKRWPRPLSIFDDGYNFHFEYQGITTVEEFWQRIEEEEKANLD